MRLPWRRREEQAEVERVREAREELGSMLCEARGLIDQITRDITIEKAAKHGR